MNASKPVAAVMRAGMPTMFAAAPVVGKLSAKLDPRYLLMGGFLLLVHPEGRLATVGFTLVAGAIYLAALWLIRAADADERQLLRRALRRG